jgi:hypothetical protein
VNQFLAALVYRANNERIVFIFAAIENKPFKQ